MKRNLYLKTTPVNEALEKYTEVLKSVIHKEYENIPVTESLNRITSEAIYAKYCSPLFNAAAMDGIAVIAERTNGATEILPVELDYKEDYIIVDTGDPIRQPYDAVIMAEDIVEADNNKVRIFNAAVPWQHVRPIGEDIVKGELIIPSFHKIRPVDIGVLLSAGITQVKVIKKPVVAIFPTGTEIIEPTEEPVEGSIIESNSRMFENLVVEAGAQAHRFPPINDDYNMIKSSIVNALDTHDMIIVNAGSSAGTEDYTVDILKELGKVIIHGVAIKPGKPVILAIVNNKPVIGLPGYPVSAFIGFEKFVIPVLNLLSGSQHTKRPVVEATLSKRLVSSIKHTEYVRVKVGNVNGKYVAAPLPRGAGAAMSLVRADGFCSIRQELEGIEAGEKVDIELIKPLNEIEKSIVIIGSHDIILDETADYVANHDNDFYISSTHVGSIAGLMALKRCEAHFAPIHLLDTKTGEYNVSYLKEMFDFPMALIKGVSRIQGIMVKKGNPLNIMSIKDLPSCRYVNRQRGAGTRVLFDYLLQNNQLAPDDINGYDREATTHMAVAALVQSDSADAGMGIWSVANAMSLDFIEVGIEEYDFAVPVEFLKLNIVQKFIKVLKDNDWRERITALGGYGCEKSGDVILIN